MDSLTSFNTKILNLLLQNPVVVDVETTTTHKGNPFVVGNKLVTIHIKEKNKAPYTLTKDNFKDCLLVLEGASVLIGFNFKFDLHWLQRELGFKAKCIWCCQLAEFIFSDQSWKYPSLEETMVKYEVGHKLDIVATEYWDKGIDTDAIPLDILSEYGEQDVNGTFDVFMKQVELFQTSRAHQLRLFRLHCNDLLVLQEMEFNGIMYDTTNSLLHAKKLEEQVYKVEATLNEFTDGVPINFSSGDHVSVFLYGGTITTETRIPIGVYKSGAKLGQSRYKILKTDYTCTGFATPLKNSELKKEGYYSTDEATLLSLKGNKTLKFIVSKLLERSKLMKLRSTYLEGLPALVEKMLWPPDMIYSNLNQCVASTGRLSSTKPNQQNFPKEAKQYCVSRY